MARVEKILGFIWSLAAWVARSIALRSGAEAILD
jgi:hypothetical protein